MHNKFEVLVIKSITVNLISANQFTCNTSIFVSGEGKAFLMFLVYWFNKQNNSQDLETYIIKNINIFVRGYICSWGDEWWPILVQIYKYICMCKMISLLCTGEDINLVYTAVHTDTLKQFVCSNW